MSDTPPLCLSVSPYLFVSDVERSAAYYRDVLGFSFERFWGEPPCFVMVCRDAVQLMLSSKGDGARPNRTYDRHAWDAYVYVCDADTLHAECVARGADVVSPPTDQVYGCREFEVRDPDGHVICFGQDH